MAIKNIVDVKPLADSLYNEVSRMITEAKTKTCNLVLGTNFLHFPTNKMITGNKNSSH